jgi:hypothetical protein
MGFALRPQAEKGQEFGQLDKSLCLQPFPVTQSNPRILSVKEMPKARIDAAW